MGATADDFEVIARFHVKNYASAVDLRNFGSSGHPKADRGRGHMAYVEVGAEALMFVGQEVLDRIECRRLDYVDHDRRGQDRYAAGPDKWRGMLGAHQKVRGSFEAGGNAAEIDHQSPTGGKSPDAFLDLIPLLMSSLPGPMLRAPMPR